jgi:hypothetical protein
MDAHEMCDSFALRMFSGISLFCMAMAQAQAQTGTTSDWQYQFSPYLWAPGVAKP